MTTSLIKFRSDAVDANGDVVNGADIEVRKLTDNSLATIYSSEAGAAQTNPFTADADGGFEFWANPGAYEVTVGTAPSANTYPLYLNAAPLGYATRSALVADVAAGATWPDGTVLSDGTVTYVSVDGSTAISDLGGLEPFGDVYVDHFGENTTPGTTNMSAFCQSAIDWVASSGGGEVNFTSGTYAWDAMVTLPSKVILIGQGEEVTVISYATGFNGPGFETDNWDAMSTPTPGEWFTADGVRYGFGILRLKIDGRRSVNTTSQGVRLYGKGFTLKNLKLVNFGDVALHTRCGNQSGQTDETDMPETSISAIWIKNCGSHGYLCEGPHDAVVDTLYVGGCKNGGNTARGMYCTGDAQFAGPADIGYVHAYDCDVGFEANTPNVKITGTVQGESCQKEGIRLSAARLVANCLIAFNNNLLNGNHHAVYANCSDSAIGTAHIRTGSFDCAGIYIGAQRVSIQNAYINCEGVSNIGIIVAESYTKICATIYDCNSNAIQLGKSGGVKYSAFDIVGNEVDGAVVKMTFTGNQYNRWDISGNSSTSPQFLDASGAQTAFDETDEVKSNYRTGTNVFLSRQKILGPNTIDMTSTAVQTISLNHDLFAAPLAKDIQLSLSTGRRDFELDFMVVDTASITAASFDVAVKLRTASAAGVGFVAALLDIT